MTRRERLIAGLTERLLAAGLPVPTDWDLALAVVDEMVAVQNMVGGGSNSLAMARCLDVDESVARLAFTFAALDARRRAEIALGRQGFRPRLSDRDNVLIAQAVQAGAELALAVRRVAQ